jgi:hypothetical protein
MSEGGWVLEVAGGGIGTNEGREDGVSDHLAEEDDTVDETTRGIWAGKVGDSARGCGGGVCTAVLESELGIRHSMIRVGSE